MGGRDAEAVAPPLQLQRPPVAALDPGREAHSVAALLPALLDGRDGPIAGVPALLDLDRHRRLLGEAEADPRAPREPLAGRDLRQAGLLGVAPDRDGLGGGAAGAVRRAGEAGPALVLRHGARRAAAR